MNLALLGNWMTLIFCPIAILLLIVWAARGRQSTALRVTGGVLLLLGMAGVAMAKYLAP